MSVVTATILSAGKKMDPVFELVSVDVSHEVNRIPHAQIVFLDGDAAQQKFTISDDAFFEPGKEIEIKVRYEDAPEKETTVFKGLVVGLGVQAGDFGSLLTVELKAAAVKLAHGRKSEIFRKKTDDQIISDVIGNAGLKKGKIETTKTKHPELVQYYCSDWDFILSRADAQGLLIIVEDDQVSLAKIAVTGSPKFTFEFGLSEIYDFEIEADAEGQLQTVESVAWDVKTQKVTKAAKGAEFNLSQGNLKGGAIAKNLGVSPVTLTGSGPLDTKELQAWSDGAMTRSRMSLLRGRIAVPGVGKIKLLDVIEIAGVGKRFNGKTLVTGVRHQVDQNGWKTDVQFGLAAAPFAERRDIVDVPAAGLLPAVNGLQIGVVDKFEEDPDKEFRVKVILPAIDEKQGAVWARLGAPDAGKGRGYFFRPEPGDEVILGFINDDPRYAVILGALYGSKNTPPDAVSKLTQDNVDKAIVSKTGSAIRFLDDKKSAIFIETPEANKIIFDDDAQSIEIADQHGNEVKMSKDGVVIKSAKDLTIDARGNVEIKGSKVDIK